MQRSWSSVSRWNQIPALWLHFPQTTSALSFKGHNLLLNPIKEKVPLQSRKPLFTTSVRPRTHHWGKIQITQEMRQRTAHFYMLGEEVRSPTEKGKFQHTSALVPKGPAGHTQLKLLSRLQKGRSNCQGSPFPKRLLSWELGQRQGGVPRGLSIGPFQKSGLWSHMSTKATWRELMPPPPSLAQIQTHPLTHKYQNILMQFR